MPTHTCIGTRPSAPPTETPMFLWFYDCPINFISYSLSHLGRVSLIFMESHFQFRTSFVVQILKQGLVKHETVVKVFCFKFVPRKSESAPSGVSRLERSRHLFIRCSHLAFNSLFIHHSSTFRLWQVPGCSALAKTPRIPCFLCRKPLLFSCTR